MRSTAWSTWPTVLVNYNIPPWMATKTGFVMLALLIPGPHKVKNMDIYLEPLIEELEIRWRGIHIRGFLGSFLGPLRNAKSSLH